MKILAISNQKGGCGKTTTAINLSFALAEYGRKVLLIDIDPQAHATMGLGFKTVSLENSVYSLFMAGQGKMRSIQDLILYVDERVDMIPSHIILSTVEHELKDKDNGIMILFRALMYSDISYDYVIIDCPPNLGFLTFNAIRAANQVIVPVETSIFAIMGVSKLVSMIELIKLKLNHSPTIKGLVTMYDPYAEFSQKMVIKIKNMFKDNILKSAVSMDVALKEAQEQFKSIIKFNRNSEGARDYMNLAEEIVSQERENLPDSIYKELQRILYSNVYSKEKAFNYFAPDANTVYVVGDFNNWEMSESSKLLKKSNGAWERTFYLGPGHYRYKFIVDGLYFIDPENPKKEMTQYGNYDSVFDV